MNKNQWFVLGALFLLANLWITFVGINWDCSSAIHDEYDNNGLLAFNEINPVDCGVQYQVYLILNKITWFLLFICIIMGLLESKQKKKV